MPGGGLTAFTGRSALRAAGAAGNAKVTFCYGPGGPGPKVTTRSNPSAASRGSASRSCPCCARTVPSGTRRPQRAPGAGPGRASMTVEAGLQRGGHDDRDGGHAVPAGHGEQRPAGVGFHVGGVDDGREPAPQPGGGQQVQDGDGVAGGVLVALVAGDGSAQLVQAEDLPGPGLPGQGGLAGSRGADEQDQAGSFGERPGDGPGGGGRRCHAAFSWRAARSAWRMLSPTARATGGGKALPTCR